MDIISLMTIRIILSFSSENKSHRIKVVFPMSREKRFFFKQSIEQSINEFEPREDTYLLPHNKIIFKVNDQEDNVR